MWRSMRTAGLAPYGGGNAVCPRPRRRRPRPARRPALLARLTRCVGDVCLLLAVICKRLEYVNKLVNIYSLRI